jgi:hypothetical protein
MRISTGLPKWKTATKRCGKSSWHFFSTTSVHMMKLSGPTGLIHFSDMSVYTKSSNFCDITPCRPLKANRSFGGSCRLHLQGTSCYLVHGGFLLRLLFHPLRSPCDRYETQQPKNCWEMCFLCGPCRGFISRASTEFSYEIVAGNEGRELGNWGSCGVEAITRRQPVIIQQTEKS